MRIIAGTYRSRLLTAPNGRGTRPTGDRLRETLFNIIAPRIPGSRFCDLYAGTGAVGIEALSRGAVHVWFAENAAPALAALRANLAALRIASGYTLEDRGVGALMQRLGKLSQTMDIVFLDPPYELANEYESTLSFLGSTRGHTLLAENAIVIAEHLSKSPLAERYGVLSRTRIKEQGESALSFYSAAQLS